MSSVSARYESGSMDGTGGALASQHACCSTSQDGKKIDKLSIEKLCCHEYFSEGYTNLRNGKMDEFYALHELLSRMRRSSRPLTLWPMCNHNSSNEVHVALIIKSISTEMQQA